MLDILGFKGIWRRHRPQDVVQRLHAIRDYCHGMRDLRPDGAPPPSNPDEYAYVRFLSDTIVIARYCDDENPLSVLRSFANVLTLVSGAMIATLDDPLPLPIRGAVVTGQFLIDDVFLIGPAIDEAAHNERAANAAIVWLADSARQKMEAAIQDAEARQLARVQSLMLKAHTPEYEVPLKNGGHHAARVINPFTSSGDESLIARPTFRARSGIRAQVVNAARGKDGGVAGRRFAT